MTPRTPSSGRVPNSQNQNPSLPPSSPTAPSDSPYFLPLTSRPSTSPSSPCNSPYLAPNSSTSTSHPTGPVITTSFMSRNDNSISSPDQLPPSTRLSSDAIQQFALHIPPPPTLSLSQSAVRNPPANAANLAPRVSVSSMPSPMPNTGLDSFPSPMDRTRRMPPSNQTPDMTLSTSSTAHTLSVMLPTSIQPEMVTISANKGDRLRVVADAWHMEGESEFLFRLLRYILPLHSSFISLTPRHLTYPALLRSLRMADKLPTIWRWHQGCPCKIPTWRALDYWCKTATSSLLSS